MASRRRRLSSSLSMMEPTHPTVSATLQGTGPPWCQGPVGMFTLNSVCTATGVTPPIRIESSASSVTEGQTLDLDCVVAGQGQATITWYKRGGSLPAKHQVGGDRGRVGDGGCGWPVDANTPCHHVPRYRGPACGCHSSQWPIRGSMCAGQTQAASPARPPSLSPSPPVTAPATVSVVTG